MSLLQWIYLINFIFLTMHETDAAYWKEWRMFGKIGASLSDKQGLTVFVLARIPFYLPLLYGLINIDRFSGLIISLIFSLFLIGHFVAHMLARKQGRPEFAWPISYIVQFGLLTLSVVQVYLTVSLLI